MGKKEGPLHASTSWTKHLGERLRYIRELAGVTQVELAARLKMGQTALSHLEQRPDMLVSTMWNYLEALGADLRIDANLGKGQARPAGLSSTQADQPVLPLLGDWPRRQGCDVVLSIKPQYSGKIVKGEKTVELRRRFPAHIGAGNFVIIYETSPTCAITGVVEIADVLTGSVSAIWKEYGREACIERGDFEDYFAGTKNGFAIKLRGARKLPRKLALEELRERFRFEPPQSFLYAPPDLREALLHEYSKVPH